MSGALKARRYLIASGFGAALSAAARPDSIQDASPEQEVAMLAEVATYIGDTDPLMIAAAWLLEQDGYERSQRTLFSAPSCTSR